MQIPDIEQIVSLLYRSHLKPTKLSWLNPCFGLIDKKGPQFIPEFTPEHKEAGKEKHVAGNSQKNMMLFIA